MTDIEQQARELLAAECEKVCFTEAAQFVRNADFTGAAGVGYETAIRAIVAALAAQPQAPAAAVPAAFGVGQRAEWEDDIGRWWPVRITGSQAATYDARLDDGTEAIGYTAGRFRAAPAPEVS